MFGGKLPAMELALKRYDSHSNRMSRVGTGTMNIKERGVKIRPLYNGKLWQKLRFETGSTWYNQVEKELKLENESLNYNRLIFQKGNVWCIHS